MSFRSVGNVDSFMRDASCLMKDMIDAPVTDIWVMRKSVLIVMGVYFIFYSVLGLVFSVLKAK